MKLLYSQAGYHTFSDKTAIVIPSREVDGGQFALIQDGHEVARGDLQPWSEACWLAEFTRVRTTGWNELRVALSNGERAHTPSFRISPVTYRGMAKETLLWLNPQRCGTPVEFWHGTCHRDDPAPGGWHSGDSWDKRADEAWLAVWACAMLDLYVRDFTTVPGESMPHIVYEAAWGGKWLLMLQGEEARFASGVRGSPTERSERSGQAPTERSGQAGFGVRCEDDTAARELGQPLDIPTCAMIGYALCQLSIRVRRWNRELADRCLESAAQLWRTYRKQQPAIDELESQPRSWHSAFALLDLGLCCAIAARKDTFELNLTDTAPAREDLEHRIDLMLRIRGEIESLVAGVGLNRESGAVTSERASLLHQRWLRPLALAEFIDKFPEGTRTELARDALNGFCDRCRSYAQSTAHSLVPPTIGPGSMEEAWPRGNPYILSTAFVLARVADVLDRFDLLAIAERHVQWVFGRNPLAVSMMCGVGAESMSTHGPQTGMRGLGAWFTPNAIYRGHQDGYQVGGVVNGIIADESGEPFLDLRTLHDERERNGLECNRNTNAYSLPATAWMMLACGAIDRALERSRGGGGS